MSKERAVDRSGGSRPDPSAADQRAAWNGALGEMWLSRHELLDAMLEPLGARLLDDLPEGIGSACDIGCATGETTGRLSAALTDAEVSGVDISEPLIRAARSARPDLRFLVADAGADDLGGPHDHVSSRFGTMFFPDPRTAFGHLRSSLTPGAELRMMTWQAPPENEWVRLPVGVASDLVELPGPPVDPTAPGPFSLADADRTCTLLEDAGFVDVTFEPVVRRLGLPPSVRDAAAFLLSVLPTGPVLGSLEPDRVDQVVDAVAEAIPRDADGTDLSGAAWFVTARNVR